MSSKSTRKQIINDTLHNSLINAMSERNIRLQKIAEAVKRLERGDKIVELCCQAADWQAVVDEIKTKIEE